MCSSTPLQHRKSFDTNLSGLRIPLPAMTGKSAVFTARRVHRLSLRQQRIIKAGSVARSCSSKLLKGLLFLYHSACKLEIVNCSIFSSRLRMSWCTPLRETRWKISPIRAPPMKVKASYAKPILNRTDPVQVFVAPVCWKSLLVKVCSPAESNSFRNAAKLSNRILGRNLAVQVSWWKLQQEN